MKRFACGLLAVICALFAFSPSVANAVEEPAPLTDDGSQGAVQDPVTHVHDWEYSVGENYVSAKCVSTEGECDYAGKELRLTFSVSSKDYDGTAVSPCLPSTEELDAWENAGCKEEKIVVMLKKATPGTDVYVACDEAVLPGSYRALFVINDVVPVPLDFTINKLGIAPSVTISGWTAGAQASTPSVAGNTGEGSVTYEYKKKDADDSAYSTAVPTEAGDYVVRATIAETDIYKSGVATADFTVAAAPAKKASGNNAKNGAGNSKANGNKKLPQTGDAAGIASVAAAAGASLTAWGVARRRK